MKIFLAFTMMLLSAFLPSKTNAGKPPFSDYQGSLSIAYPPNGFTSWEIQMTGGDGGYRYMTVYGNDPFSPSEIIVGTSPGSGSSVTVTSILRNENGENSVQIWGTIGGGSSSVYYKAKYTLASPATAMLTGRSGQ